jgi:acyl-CoA synthetase (AMP-forming)/AMP-acid ligase II
MYRRKPRSPELATIRPSVGPFKPEPVQRLVTAAAERWPERVAVIDGDRRYTFGELNETTNMFAVALASMDIGKGDFVGILAPNCTAFVVSFFGILKSGATVTTINSGYREIEVANQLRASGAATLIVHESLVDVATLAAKDVATLKQTIVIKEDAADASSFWGLIENATGTPPTFEVDPTEELAALPFSSGTTGLSKGVMLTHANLHANVRQLKDRDEETAMRQGDMVLVHLPLFHIYAMMIMQQAIYAGATQVMMGRFDMEVFLSLLQEHRISVLFTAPPVGVALSQTPLIDSYDVSSLRFIMFGAAPMSAQLQLRIEERMGTSVVQGYGLTETSPVSHMDFTDNRAKPGTIGPPLGDIEQRVVNMEDGVTDLKPGELGELLLRGPNVMKGYYNEPGATANAITPEGWFHTGDLVTIDEDGYVTVLDRKKELIKYNGFQVPPAELEGILLEHPAVADVAVIGKENLETGEIPKAFVVKKAGVSVTGEELMEHVGSKVATFKRVREVEFVDSIPKNPSGKLLRRVLVERERARTRS